MALNGLFCADVPLRNYSLTHSLWHTGSAFLFFTHSSTTRKKIFQLECITTFLAKRWQGWRLLDHHYLNNHNRCAENLFSIQEFKRSATSMTSSPSATSSFTGLVQQSVSSINTLNTTQYAVQSVMIKPRGEKARGRKSHGANKPG